MKPPIKAIKKIIKFCESKNDWECNTCEIQSFCDRWFNGCPNSSWKHDFKKLKKELEKNEVHSGNR